jgi:hypothetical protein
MRSSRILGGELSFQDIQVRFPRCRNSECDENDNANNDAANLAENPHTKVSKIDGPISQVTGQG